MKKKLTTLGLILTAIVCLAFGFAGCNKSNEDNGLLFGTELTKLTAQVDVLRNLDQGSADIGIMDSIMAGYYMKNGQYASKLQKVEGLVLANENYGIAAKKGNKALVEKINEAIIALTNNGECQKAAETFGLQDELVAKKDTVNPIANATDNSWNDIANSKKLIIGYTLFAPICYNVDKKLTGFDIELAKKVVSWLNAKYNTSIELQPQQIKWANKENDLTTGTIDLVWNGLTITADREANMEMSIPYLRNQQVAIIRKADAKTYIANGDTDAIKLKNFKNSAKKAIVAVEKGSAGQDCIEIK